MTRRNESSDEGRGSLAESLTLVAVPSGLQDRVRRSLVARGLLAPERRPSQRRRSWVLAMVCLVFGVVAGYGLSTLTRATKEAPRPRYALLLYGGDPPANAAEGQSRVREYGGWAASLSGDVRFVGGHELGELVGDLQPADSVGRTNPMDRVEGFFIIDAPSAEVANRIAAECPHLKYRGRVIVMRIASS